MSAMPPPHTPLVSISALAMRLGVTVKSLRYYEDMGLVRSERLAVGARGFDPAMVERLTLIVGLRAVGMSLQIIGHLLNDRGLRQSSDGVRAQLRRVLDDKRALMSALQTFIDSPPGDPVSASRARLDLEAALAASPSKARARS